MKPCSVGRVQTHARRSGPTGGAEAAVAPGEGVGHVGGAPAGVRFVPFGPITRRRQVAGAAVVMAGAIPVALLAGSSYGRPPNLSVVLLAIGIIGMVGWMVDGRRYLGAASAAVAIGGGITTAREAFLDEYALMFSFLAVALIGVVRVNPRAINGSAGLLFYVASSTIGLHQSDQSPLPRELIFALVMLTWGGMSLLRSRKVPPGATGVSCQPLRLEGEGVR